MLPPYLSPTRFLEVYLRRSLTAAGLTQRTVAIGETTVHLWGPPPESRSDKEKPALLLLHGFGPSAVWQWRRQVQAFSSSFRLYLPDLVFFGLSSSSSHQRSEIFQAECMAKVMEKEGVEKFHVVGTSYGGIVAYHMARLYPDKVDKVVIASSGINMRRSDNSDLLKRASCRRIEELMLPSSAADLRRLLALASSSQSLHMLPDFIWNDFIDKLYRENREKKVELLENLTLGKDEKSNVASLSQEVLVIWGDQDQIFPVKMAYELKEILGPKTRLEIIKDTSHIPQLERSQEFNDAVLEFLNSME
ncbi:PREDICTED: uncharacterized protein LOC104803710 [Tarenaya hassleriana]|uniref:uncharacterized protein LOC104803710 n=1 Tax=Tarenaya hassleriana TaxID=28532 RepID=UPI00053C379E|nr:PREDICTED: uncharacterized protein LOC104803710 [Tarenaya hassleriana]